MFTVAFSPPFPATQVPKLDKTIGLSKATNSWGTVCECYKNLTALPAQPSSLGSENFFSPTPYKKRATVTWSRNWTILKRGLSYRPIIPKLSSNHGFDRNQDYHGIKVDPGIWIIKLIYKVNFKNACINCFLTTKSINWFMSMCSLLTFWLPPPKRPKNNLKS